MSMFIRKKENGPIGPYLKDIDTLSSEPNDSHNIHTTIKNKKLDHPQLLFMPSKQRSSVVAPSPETTTMTTKSSSTSISSSTTHHDAFTAKIKKRKLKKYPQAENTPAYTSLQSHNLLVTTYRKECFEDIFVENDLTPNSSHRQNSRRRWKWGVYWTPGCGWLLYTIFNKELIVPPGHICCFTDDDNNYLFAKPGIHNIDDPFLKQASIPIPLHSDHDAIPRTVVQHGNRCLLTVPEGMIGYATDIGQPVLLPPGLHSWISETMRFHRMYRVGDNPVLVLGPFTLVTVEEGFVGVSSENGRLRLLSAGETHLLDHAKWRFERFLNVESQHDELEKVGAGTADNVLVNVQASVVWRIEDVIKVAGKLAETRESDVSSDTMEYAFGVSAGLRRDVLRHVDAALSAFVGCVNYGRFFYGCFSMEMGGQGNDTNPDDTSRTTSPIREGRDHNYYSKNTSLTPSTFDESEVASSPSDHAPKLFNPFFDSRGIATALSKANQMTHTFGVEILDISIISVNPSDKSLLASVVAASVTSAETLRIAYAKRVAAETDATTQRIRSEREAETALVKARAEAEAGVVRAEGEKTAAIRHAGGMMEAAKLLETSEVAVALETLKTSALAIRGSDKFFFGKDLLGLPDAIQKGVVMGIKGVDKENKGGLHVGNKEAEQI